MHGDTPSALLQITVEEGFHVSDKVEWIGYVLKGFLDLLDAVSKHVAVVAG